MVMDGVIIGAIVGAVEVGFVAVVALATKSNSKTPPKKHKENLTEYCVNRNLFASVR